MKGHRRHHSAEDKLKLIRLHLIEKKQPASKICDEAGVAPSLFHRWQEQLFTNGALALKNKYRPEQNKDQARVAKLESKIRQKDEVLAESIVPGRRLGRNRYYLPDLSREVFSDC